MMDDISRRTILAATAAGVFTVGAASAQSDGSIPQPQRPGHGGTDPGPRNLMRDRQNPDILVPPSTDRGTLPKLRFSFSDSHVRQESGGWTRQVTERELGISKDVAGVNMRLTRGGIRELHWHLFAEWAYVTAGSCRITTIDEMGRANVEDVQQGGLWYFPAGLPHSLQGIGDDGCEFILCFDEGRASEFNTLLLTEWMAHTQPEVLALNFGMPAETFSKIPLHDLYIFQGKMPGPIEAEQQEAAGDAGLPKLRSVFQLNEVAPVAKTRGGEVRIADSTNFPIATNIAAALVTIHPGGMREMHWHPNADEWLYIIAGQGEATLFDTGPNVVTQNFNPGDVGYIKRAFGHYLRNTADKDLVTCNAVLSMRAGGKLEIDYKLFRNDEGMRLEITRSANR